MRSLQGVGAEKQSRLEQGMREAGLEVDLRMRFV
jgi:hypothetical protein